MPQLHGAGERLCDTLGPVSASWWMSITSGGTPHSSERSGARGRERLIGCQVSDWLVPTRDLVSDRGMMGDGVIDIPCIRHLGGDRPVRRPELEIVSPENLVEARSR